MAEPHPPSKSLQTEIAENLARVNEQIHVACDRHGRSQKDVRLIAVSKTKPIEAVLAAIDAGQIDFGENQIQDALTKIPSVPSNKAQWHFIGPLQSNKTKHLPGHFQWWHTLQRLDIAQRVSNKAVALNASVDALIQVNVINDPAKSGLTRDELPRLIDQLREADLNGIRLRGLMTIGPHGGKDTEIRRCFSELRSLLEITREKFNLDNFDQLSMGMTNDMEQAIAEGATMLRVGRAIFGSR
jgi:pyridoxal phosphate enzyme (YggS family)